MMDLKNAVARHNKTYRDLHRERLLNNKKNAYKRDTLVLIKCCCNAMIGMKAINEHMKSKKHFDALMKQF